MKKSLVLVLSVLISLLLCGCTSYCYEDTVSDMEIMYGSYFMFFLKYNPDGAAVSDGGAFFLQVCAEAGYRPNIRFRWAVTESSLMVVAAEEGISLLPDCCSNRLYNADNLVFVPLVGEGEEEEIIAAWQSGNQNPALGRFLTELNQKDPPY